MKTLRSFGVVFLLSTSFSGVHSAPLGVPDASAIPWYQATQPSEALVHLGKILFFDPRLVPGENQSCSSCHDPNLGYSDGVALDIKHDRKKDKRNSPHLYNLAWAPVLHWDGRTREKCYTPEDTKEEVCLPPLEGQAYKSLAKRGVYDSFIPKIKANKAYLQLFRDAFPPQGAVTHTNIAIAIGAFERTLVSNDSAYDRFAQGKENALGPEAKRGLALFKGKAGCIACHNGKDFTDYRLHRIGVASDDVGGKADQKHRVTAGGFKTPGLRNILLTGPYMHDGSLASLEEVIRFYARGGDAKESISPLIRPLDLSEQEIWDLVAFLGALTDPVLVERPEIP